MIQNRPRLTMPPISPFGRKSALTQTDNNEAQHLKPAPNPRKSALMQTELHSKASFISQKTYKRVIKRKSEFDRL
jgi:hypothetical protein